MYLIVTSQWPQTALTIGYNFLPLSPRNATPRYCPSAAKLIVPSSMSNITTNVSGTTKFSSPPTTTGYATPGAFRTSWYNRLRTRSQPQESVVLPTRDWYPAAWRGASRVATPTTAWVPRWRTAHRISHACKPRAYPSLPRIQSVLWATGCRWNVSRSSSLTKMFRDRSSGFHALADRMLSVTGGDASKASSRVGFWKSGL